MDSLLSPKLLGIVVGSIFVFVFSGLWYGPVMGSTFMNAAYPGKRGIPKAVQDRNMLIGLGRAMAGHVVSIVVLSYYLGLTKPKEGLDGMLTGLTLTAFGEGLWAAHNWFENNSDVVHLIHTVGHCLEIAAVSAILAHFKLY